jgi:hypothetical protein
MKEEQKTVILNSVVFYVNSVVGFRFVAMSDTVCVGNEKLCKFLSLYFNTPFRSCSTKSINSKVGVPHYYFSANKCKCLIHYEISSVLDEFQNSKELPLHDDF